MICKMRPAPPAAVSGTFIQIRDEVRLHDDHALRSVRAGLEKIDFTESIEKESAYPEAPYSVARKRNSKPALRLQRLGA